VAVSGLDLSRDGRELLASYESDHAYTFPVLRGGGAPALEECDGTDGGGANVGTTVAGDGNDGTVSELAVYGGHLNRLTFLKMAKYAGANDECEFLFLPHLLFGMHLRTWVSLMGLHVLCQIFAPAAIRDTPGSTRRKHPPS
jgi:hypothetical protein